MEPAQTPIPPLARTRIVILGGGFAGAYCAQALEKTLRGLDAEVLLIDANNYFVFYPLLVEAGTGDLEPRHTVVSIRSFLKRGRFLMGDVQGIDLAGQTVTCGLIGEETPRVFPYDHLVLALGSITNLPPVPGLRDHGYQLKSLADAVELRDHLIRNLERADACGDPALRRELLHLVVVGANFTGVEVAGQFQAFLQQAASHYQAIDPADCHVTLIDMSDHILAAVQDRELSTFAQTHLERRGMRVLLQHTISAVGERDVTLSTGERVATRTVIWCAGIAAHPLVHRVEGLPLDPRGYILCDRELRVQGFENVWGIGDLAVNPGPDGKAYPATAQHATREGTHLAANLGRSLRGQAPLPCDLRNLGALAALGCRTGVAKIMGIKLSGFLAWFLWRTVYLMKMPGFARSVRIALDWTIDLIFARDYVQLGLHRRRPPEE